MGTNVASTNDLIQYLMNAFASVVDLFVVCWFSQKICDGVRSQNLILLKSQYQTENSFQNSAVPETSYESTWYAKSIRYQKGIIQIIQNNQRRLHLEAFKITHLSMEQFLRVRI